MAMTAQELRALCLAAFGHNGQSAMARALGISPRHFRRVLKGDAPITAKMEGDIERVLLTALMEAAARCVGRGMSDKPALTMRRIDRAPKGKEKSVLRAAEIHHERVAATGLVSMTELLSAGPVSRKTVLKHIKSGILAGEKHIAAGKEMWFFEPDAARTYVEKAVLGSKLHKDGVG